MFDLFAQGERPITRSEGGLGIGLTIVRKLVEMEGGSIMAGSPGPGQGSEFLVSLPPAVRPSAASTRFAPDPGPAKKWARVLVVDDKVDTAAGIARLLKLLGNQVESAYDGLATLEKARAFRPEFGLLDIGLPRMDGDEVASQLRDATCCRDAGIIAVSG